MMHTQQVRTLSLFLALLMLCLTALPAQAAETVTSATAATIQLMKTEGTVSVTNSSTRSLTVRDRMRLYNGYHVETQAKSYAWINLDNARLAKLDAVSGAEVRKAGKVLELLVSSGNLYFNVTSPLKEDETLNIRASTMVVGIRGTCGWVRVLDRWSAEVYILEGRVQCSVTDPVTGQVKTATLRSGDKAIATAYPQDREGDKCDIILERFGPGDIDGFVLSELAQDPGLCGDIYEQSGMDVLPPMGLLESIRRQLEGIRDDLDGLREQIEKGGLPAGDARSRLDDLRQQLEDVKERLEQAGPDDDAQQKLDEAEEHLRQAQEALDNARSQNALDSLGDAREDLEEARRKMVDGAQQKGGDSARERREQDEQEMQDTLDRIEEELAGQENNVSSDPVWEEENEPEPAPGRPGGGTASGGGTSGGVTDDPVDDPEEEDPPLSTVTLTIPGVPTGDTEIQRNFVSEVQDALDDDSVGEVILDTYPAADRDGSYVDYETFQILDGMTVPDGKTLTIGDNADVVIGTGISVTVDGTMAGTNTLENNGTLTVNSPETMKMASIENSGTITNTPRGHIVADTITTSNAMTNRGLIDGSVIINGGTFTLDGGTINAGESSAVSMSNGSRFIMDDGTINGIADGSTVTNTILLEDTSTFTMENGTIGTKGSIYDRIMLNNDSTFTMNDGIINIVICSNDNAAFIMEGGIIDMGDYTDFLIYDNSTFIMNDGTIGTSEDGYIDIQTSGYIGDTVPSFTMNGGTIGSGKNSSVGFIINANCSLIMNGGTIGSGEYANIDIRFSNLGSFIMTGGTIGSGEHPNTNFTIRNWMTFTMDGGTINGGDDSGITCTNGAYTTFTMTGGTINNIPVMLASGETFTMEDGEIISSSDDATVQCNGDVTLNLNGGTITNSGEGYAIATSTAAITPGDTVIRARQDKLISLGDSTWIPDGYISSYNPDDNYYYLAEA